MHIIDISLGSGAQWLHLLDADNACVVVNAALAMGALFDPAPDLV